MMKIMVFGFLLAFACQGALGQSIDSLKLSDAEVPAGYSKSEELICLTPHGCSFYEQADLYEAMFGKVVKKAFQSYSKKGDKGSILYMEFEKEFEGQSFLNGFLWRKDLKPSRSEPDDYYVG